MPMYFLLYKQYTEICKAFVYEIANTSDERAYF